MNEAPRKRVMWNGEFYDDPKHFAKARIFWTKVMLMRIRSRPSNDTLLEEIKQDIVRHREEYRKS
jgi:hypothetical protein